MVLESNVHVNISKILLVISQIGTGIGYVIFITQYFNISVCLVDENWCGKNWLGYVLSCFLITFLSYFRSLKLLLKYNIVGIFIQIVSLVFIIIFSLYTMAS